MDFTKFNKKDDLSEFPPKPEIETGESKVISISLNFIVAILIYLFLFKGDVKFLSAMLMVIFIHDSGHLFMMRRFGYQERGLFIISLLSQFSIQFDHKTTLSRKLIILLMGPLPGVLIGISLLFYGEYVQNTQLITLAWIFMVFNCLNLLPLDPFEGAALINILHHKKNYHVQLIFTILLTVITIMSVLFFKVYLILFIPLYLIYKLKSLKKLNQLRDHLENNGIDYRLGYEELNNKQYWILKRALIEHNYISTNEDEMDLINENYNLKLIRHQMKSVLLNLPEDNLAPGKKKLVVFIWLVLLLVSLASISSYLILKVMV